MAVKITSYLVEAQPSGTWVPVAASDVLDVTGGIELSGNTELPIAFGDTAVARCTIKLRDAAFAAIPDHMPIRVTFTVDGGSDQVFQGIVTDAKRSYRARAWELSCEGARSSVSASRIYSPLFERRPAATKTTATSIEDPSDPLYVAGPTNWALWQAGGRPAEQAASYPAAAFFYSCEQAILAPRYAWLAGENAWTELLLLAQAVGGQLYQAGDGVVYYKQPLSFAAGSAAKTFTISNVGDIEEQTVMSTQIAGRVVVPYIPRRVHPLQQVASDVTVRLVDPGATVTFEVETELPLTHLEVAAGLLSLATNTTTSLRSDAFNITYLDGRTVAAGAGGYTHSVTTSAKRFLFSVTNGGTLPFYINSVTLRGKPIVAGTPGTATAGSGARSINKADNYFVQTRGHAQRLADMALSFYGIGRPTYRLPGCDYDPTDYVGRAVALTVAAWSISALPCLITAIEHTDTGKTASYTLVSTSGLPASGSYYLVGAMNYSGQTRKLTW